MTTTTSRAAVLVTAVALSASPVLLAPTAAAAVDGRPKALIEHVENEHTIVLRRDGHPSGVAPSSGDGRAADWRPGLSAALGALVLGGAVVAARQVAHHHALHHRGKAVAH